MSVARDTVELDANSNPGYCHCCRESVVFDITGPWLRDEYICRKCHSIPRQRHINFILDTQYPNWKNGAWHESSPSNNYLARWIANFTYSQYFPDIPPGQSYQGTRCENLESLTFADKTFDFFVTQDVLEHVFDPAAALREVMRVLKPGGVHIFTAPKHAGLKKSKQRAGLVKGEVVHFEEEAYHGNPVGDGKALVTWDYGDDFSTLVRQWCGYPVETYLSRDRSLGIDGEFLEVFVIKKEPDWPTIQWRVSQFFRPALHRQRSK